jgi:hypothetical protein
LTGLHVLDDQQNQISRYDFQIVKLNEDKQTRSYSHKHLEYSENTNPNNLVDLFDQTTDEAHMYVMPRKIQLEQGVRIILRYPMKVSAL